MGEKKDIKGQKFGRLTAVSRTEERDSAGSYLWECVCSCPAHKTKKVSVRTLESGNSQSCGCLRAEESSRRLNRHEGSTVQSITRSRPKNAKNPAKGVYPVRNKFIAALCFKGQRHHLGTFESVSDAVEARKKAEEVFFSPYLKKYQNKAAESTTEPANDTQQD